MLLDPTAVDDNIRQSVTGIVGVFSVNGLLNGDGARERKTETGVCAGVDCFIFVFDESERFDNDLSMVCGNDWTFSTGNDGLRDGDRVGESDRLRDF